MYTLRRIVERYETPLATVQAIEIRIPLNRLLFTLRSSIVALVTHVWVRACTQRKTGMFDEVQRLSYRAWVCTLLLAVHAWKTTDKYAHLHCIIPALFHVTRLRVPSFTVLLHSWQAHYRFRTCPLIRVHDARGVRCNKLSTTDCTRPPLPYVHAHVYLSSICLCLRTGRTGALNSPPHGFLEDCFTLRHCAL